MEVPRVACLVRPADGESRRCRDRKREDGKNRRRDLACPGHAFLLIAARRAGCSTRHYEHFLSPPTDVSLFWPGGHLPDGFVSGLPRPGPSSIAAYAVPLAASAMAAASAVMRFFMNSPPLYVSGSK